MQMTPLWFRWHSKITWVLLCYIGKIQWGFGFASKLWNNWSSLDGLQERIKPDYMFWLNGRMAKLRNWIRDCKLNNVESLDGESIYLLPRICTLSTKLRNFQFKFLHRRIAADSFLFKIRFSELNLCFVKPHKKRCFIFCGNAWSQKPFGVTFNNFSSLLI